MKPNDAEHGRYQMMLTPCVATNRTSWHVVIASADTILGLWNQIGWRSNLDADQTFVIVDSKKGTTLTEEEYKNLVNKLKGW